MRPFRAAAEVAAPVERVWSVFMDVERWPRWTASIRGIERLTPGPLKLSSRVRIRQPRFPPAIWTVTDYQDRKGFTWTSRSPGVVVTATHSVAPSANGSRVELLLEFSGPLGGLLAALTRGITERYLSLEINGLKRESERAPSASPP
jgi:uncharacterized membrane protein